MKLSLHSKQRISERANVWDKAGQNDFFKNALRKGIAPQNMKDSKIKEYLLNKEKKHCQVKLYKGYVFIHSKNSKRLYTMYKLPKELEKEIK